MKERVIRNMLKVIMKNDTDFLSSQDLDEMGFNTWRGVDATEIKEKCLDTIADFINNIPDNG